MNLRRLGYMGKVAVTRAIGSVPYSAAVLVPTATISGHMPQLDSLRAVSVTMVMFHHFVSPQNQSFLGTLPLGLLGVKLFFVLSGFLITGILLRARLAIQGGDRTSMLLKQFYVRRLLRIFPLYYFVVGVCFMLGVVPVREEIVWLGTHTLNFRSAYLGWYPANIAHFWSLSVEEQFYLVWPCVVLFSPVRHLWKIGLCFAVLGPAYWFAAMLLELGSVAYSAFPLSSFDALGAGALLAIASCGGLGQGRAWFVERVWRCILPSTIAVLVALKIFEYTASGRFVHAVFFDSVVAILFFWLIGRISLGVVGHVGMILDSASLRYVGRISYGIYVYHLILGEPVRRLGESIGVVWASGTITHFVIASLATLVVASVSWYFFERPINGLKRFFPTFGGPIDRWRYNSSAGERILC